MFYGCPECKGVIEVGDSLLGKKVTCPMCWHAISAVQARQLAEKRRLSIRLEQWRKPPKIVVFSILGVYAVLIAGLADAAPELTLRAVWSTIAGTSDQKKPATKPAQEAHEPAATPPRETREPAATPPQEVPEPSTFALVGVGALSLLAYAWRKRLASANG